MFPPTRWKKHRTANFGCVAEGVCSASLPTARPCSPRPTACTFTAFAHRDAVSVWASTSRRLYIIKVEGKHMACIPHPLPFRTTRTRRCAFSAPDDSGGFWIATSMGRILYGQPEDSVFQDFSDRFDTQGMTILNLLWRNHHLWLVSHNRFIHYDTQRHSLQQYTSSTAICPPYLPRPSCIPFGRRYTLRRRTRRFRISHSPSFIRP